MRRLVLAAIVLLAGAVPAWAFDTPEALLKAFYAHYLVKDFDWNSFDETAFRSKRLNELYARDEADSERIGGVARLDFDPYINGQDYEVTKLAIGKAATKGKSATAEVTFRNFDDAETLTYTLVDEGDGWVIDDVRSTGAGEKYSLRALLEAPLEE